MISPQFHPLDSLIGLHWGHPNTLKYSISCFLQYLFTIRALVGFPVFTLIFCLPIHYLNILFNLLLFMCTPHHRIKAFVAPFYICIVHISTPTSCNSLSMRRASLTVQLCTPTSFPISCLLLLFNSFLALIIL